MRHICAAGWPGVGVAGRCNAPGAGVTAQSADAPVPQDRAAGTSPRWRAALQLIVGGYAFMYAGGMVTGGRLGDLFGYRRMFMSGVISFAAASLLCGLAQSSAELVAARLLQGLTGAAMVPQVLALITATFPAAEHSRALAWFGVTMGVGFVSGQILGGGLIDAKVFGLGWRAIFLVNVPVGILALIAAAIVVPHAWGQRRPRLDPLGAAGVSASLALALALVPLTLGRADGWPAWTWVSLAASAPLLGATVLWELQLARRGGEPMLDLELFRDRAFSAGLVVNFALVFFFGSFMFVLTLLLQAGLGQGIALPSLIGVVLAHVRPERAGAAAGILTTTQQFGAASGIAVIGAIFYSALGAATSHGYSGAASSRGGVRDRDGAFHVGKRHPRGGRGGDDVAAAAPASPPSEHDCPGPRSRSRGSGLSQGSGLSRGNGNVQRPWAHSGPLRRGLAPRAPAPRASAP